MTNQVDPLALNDRMMVEWRNEDRMAVIKIELTARNCQNRGFLLVEGSKSRPLIGREDPQKKSKGFTLIWKCPSFPCHSLILTSFRYWRKIEWRGNDKSSRSPCLPIIQGMTLEWGNDNWMTNQVDPLASLLYKEWQWNEGMTIEWLFK